MDHRQKGTFWRPRQKASRAIAARGGETAPKSVSFNVRRHWSKEIHVGWFPCHPHSTGAALQVAPP